MNKLILYLLLTVTIWVLAQEVQNSDTTKKVIKHNISLEFGVHYTGNFGNKYIEPVPPSTYSFNYFAGFTRIPTFDIQFGLVYTYHITDRFSVKSGILYFNRRKNLKSDSSNVADMHLPERPTIKYNYSPNNIDGLFLIELKTKIVNVSTGLKGTIFTFYNTKKTNINGQITQNGEKFPMRRAVNPTVRLYKQFRLNKINLDTYLGADFESWSYFNLEIGVGFILINIK